MLYICLRLLWNLEYTHQQNKSFYFNWPVKKSLFCRDHQSIRKIKIEIFQTIEQHKMMQNVKLARFTFQKLDFQRVSSASMIISKQKARNWWVFWNVMSLYPKTPLHRCVSRKGSSRWLERGGYGEDPKEMYPVGLRQLVGNNLLVIFKQNHWG